MHTVAPGLRVVVAVVLAGMVFAACGAGVLSRSGSSGLVGSGPALAAARTVTPSGEATAYLERLVRTRQFSGSVLVADGGRIVLERGYGWASAAARVPNTATTRFRIGSLTKPFTAMAVLELENAGRLRLTDHVCRFISECPAAWGPIMLQELLTHTSGIPDYTTLRSYCRFSRQHLTPAQIVALVRGRALLFAPGSRWSYSNTGYVLLGMVIQRVSGQPYAAYLQQHVLAPLGLHNTG